MKRNFHMRCILYSKKDRSNLYIHQLLKVKALCSFYNLAFHVVVTQLCLTLCEPKDSKMPDFPVLHYLPVFSNSCSLSWWCHPATHPLSSPSPPALNLSQHQGLLQWVSSLHQVTKVLEFQHQSFQWMFRVDFLWVDWLDLLAVNGILNSLLQHHNLKASILCHAAFFMVQLSHLYITIGKKHSFDYMDLYQ